MNRMLTYYDKAYIQYTIIIFDSFTIININIFLYNDIIFIRLSLLYCYIFTHAFYKYTLFITKTKMTNGNQKTSHPKSDTHKFPVIFFTQIPQIIFSSLKNRAK